MVCQFSWVAICVFKSQKNNTSEADSGLAKLVVMTNVFFNNQQRFKYVKQIRSRFFINNWSQRFYLEYMQKVKTGLYKKADFQNLVAQNLK